MSRDYFTKQRGGYVNDDVCVTLFHLSPNVVTLWSLLHLRPNVITFRSLLHSGSVITFRSSILSSLFMEKANGTKKNAILEVHMNVKPKSYVKRSMDLFGDTMAILNSIISNSSCGMLRGANTYLFAP